MFPFRASSIFRSRWIALAWAGSVVWIAMSLVPREEAPVANASAGGAPSGATADAPMTDAELRQAATMLRDIAR